MSKYPKYLNKVILTKQKIADHEYTVLYDRQGNKYLKLEKIEIKMPELHLEDTMLNTSFIRAEFPLKALAALAPNQPTNRTQ